ncbi:hypothetical protein ACFSQ7_50420 [Paenibacillus rhizoplanae]
MKKVLYVPLDDRPVNLDDVIVQGRSAGIHVITPDVTDLKNRLDSQKDRIGHNPADHRFTGLWRYRQDPAIYSGSCSFCGWFHPVSGYAGLWGLIGSRRLRTDAGGAYPTYDAAITDLLDVIREVKQAYPDKPVYVMDTIMRLATTSFAGGLDLTAYTESRNFMLQPRRSFTQFDDILSGYNLSPTGDYGSTATF